MTNFSLNKIDKPLVMGILNLTPDSFFDGNRYNTEAAAINRVSQMLEAGADIIDIGAFSSRPGAALVSYDEERHRLIPILKAVKKHFPNATISIDTYRHKIAEEVVDEGAVIINDISGGNLDKQMFPTIARLQVPYVMMHMKGIPETMQHQTGYTDVVNDIKAFFKLKIEQLNALGFDKIILDPGFGFGKTLEQNYEILNRLNDFHDLNYPVLVGMSRKSMLYKLLDITPDEALNASTVVHTIALLNGAKILRVHDVKEAVETIKIVKKTKYAN